MARDAHDPNNSRASASSDRQRLRDENNNNDDSGQRNEAAEMTDYGEYNDPANAVTSMPRRRTVDLRRPPPTGPWGRGWVRLSSAWNRHVTLTVPHEASRDNFANERTYLAYLRTSLGLSMMGITITQVLRLERHLVTGPRFIYFDLGKPLGLMFQVAAMVLAALGAIRFWRQQTSMARGKVHVGGWEILVIMAGLLLLMVGVFVLFVAVDMIQPRHA